MPEEKPMTVEEIAEYLRQTARWVRREAPGHGLPLYGIGRRAIGYKSEIDAWRKQQRIYA